MYEDDNETKVIEEIRIIHGGKLTGAEKTVLTKYPFFKYVCYDKADKKNMDNYKKEATKTTELIQIVDLLEKELNDFCPNLTEATVVMEGISYGSASKTVSVMDLAGLNYLIRARLVSKGVNLFVTPPTEIKKWVTNYGNCSKDIMVAAFKSTHKGFEIPKMDDIADAYFMSCYARKISQDNETK